MKFLKEKQRFALRKIKSAKKAGLASVMIGLSLMAPIEGVVTSAVVHADTTSQSSQSSADITKNMTSFDKLRASDKTQNLSTVEKALYQDSKDSVALNAKTDNFTKADLENLLKLATSDSWKSKISNGDDEDMVYADDAIDDAKMLLKGQDPDSVKVEGADTMDVDRSARYDKKKTPEKISGDELAKKIDATAKKLKEAMIALDYEDKFELNSMIKRTEELIKGGKIKQDVLPTVQNALLNAKNVAGNLQATDQNVWDAEKALGDTLNQAGYNFEVDDDNTDNDIVITSKLDNKKVLGKMSNYNDPHTSDENIDLEADNAINEADSDFNGTSDDNITDNVNATLPADATSDKSENSDASDLVDQGKNIADSATFANDGIYGYNTDDQKVKSADDENPVTVHKMTDEETLEKTENQADSDDMKLKSKLADDSTQDALADAVDTAKNVDKNDKDAVKSAQSGLVQSMNSVNIQAKNVVSKQLAQLNDMTHSKDFKNLSHDNQAVVASTQTLLSNVTANPNASFADIVQAESAALNVIGQTNSKVTPTADQISKQAQITRQLADQNADIRDHVSESDVNSVVNTAKDIVKDVADNKATDHQLSATNDKMIDVQKDAIANQTKLVEKSDQHTAAADTNMKSSTMIAQDGGIKADNIGATDASMNKQAENASDTVSKAPVAISEKSDK